MIQARRQRRRLRSEVSDDLSHGRTYVVDVALAHVREERERDRAPVRILGDGEVAHAVRQRRLEMRMEVDRDEVNRRADVLRSQLGDETRSIAAQPIELEADRVEMPRMGDACTRLRATDLGQLREVFVVTACAGQPQRLHLAEAFELASPIAASTSLRLYL